MTTLLADDLDTLRALKDTAEETGRDKKVHDQAFKQWQAKCLDRMEAERSRSFKGDDYTFAKVEKVKGFVDDRSAYVRWALENDEAILEFLAWVDTTAAAAGVVLGPDFDGRFYDAITSTTQVHYKEDGNVMNQQARAHVDDGAPLPPGLNFRPDPYISMTKS